MTDARDGSAASSRADPPDDGAPMAVARSRAPHIWARIVSVAFLGAHSFGIETQRAQMAR